MSDTFSMPSLRTLLKFPFQAPGWPNRFLVGTALIWAGMFVPIVPILFVYGYLVRTARHVIRGQAPALPEWNDWSGLGVDGLRGFVVGAVFLGPSLVVMVGGWVLYFVLIFGGTLGTAESHGEQFGLFFGLMFVAIAVMFLSIFVGWLLLMLGAVPLPAALMHFIARDRLGAAFSVREWWAIVRADRWGYLAAWIVALGLMTLVYCLTLVLYFTVILCFALPIIIAPFSFYAMLVTAAVFGQTYRDGAAQAGAAAAGPLVPGAPEVGAEAAPDAVADTALPMPAEPPPAAPDTALQIPEPPQPAPDAAPEAEPPQA